MNADSGMMNTDSVIVNTGSGQAERSSVAERSWDLFPEGGVLDGNHEATDEKTPRTAPPEVRSRSQPSRDRAGVCRGAGHGHHVFAARDGRGSAVAAPRASR